MTPDEFVDFAVGARNQLAEVKEQEIPIVAQGDPLGVSRMLDSIVENAVYLRAVVEGRSGKQRAALLKRVRKALGYTYP